jgi:hypothetical protein
VSHMYVQTGGMLIAGRVLRRFLQVVSSTDRTAFSWCTVSSAVVMVQVLFSWLSAVQAPCRSAISWACQRWQPGATASQQLNGWQRYA